MVLPVIKRTVHRGIAVVDMRLGDGTSAQIPEWMTRPEGAMVSLRSPPVIPLANLRDLRGTLDSILGPLCEDSVCRGSHEAKMCLQSDGSVSDASIGSSAAHPRADRAHTTGARPAAGDPVRQNCHNVQERGRR